MIKKQAKKRFGKEGTKRLRKQWQKAIVRGKEVDLSEQIPNTNPDKKEITKAEKLLVILNKRLSHNILSYGNDKANRRRRNNGISNSLSVRQESRTGK